MKFGCCAPIRLYDEVVKAGYDYIDVNGADLYELTDEEFEEAVKKVSEGSIPCLAISGYAKTEPKMAGEGFDPKAVKAYAEKLMLRAARLGVKTIGIGSPGIRKLPEDYDRHTAWQQGKEFLEITADAASEYGMTVLLESLHDHLCNFINTPDEALDMVEEINRPEVKLVLDFYNIKPMMKDMLDIDKYMKQTIHTHTSGMGENYSRPQLTEKDYDELKAIFTKLRLLGYDTSISNESDVSKLETEGARALEIMKRAYKDAQ